MAIRQGSVRQRHVRDCPAHGDRERRCTKRCPWSIRFRDASGKRYERCGYPTSKEAEAALRSALDGVDRGTFHQAQPVPFDVFADRWLETVKPTLKPATYASYEGHVRNHLKPFFGSIVLASVTREQIERFLSAKLAAVHEKGRKKGERVWSPKTLTNALMVLKRLLGAACDWGYIASNQAGRVKPPKTGHVERDHLTPDELGRVLVAADEPWALLFRVYAFTGLRRGELLGLRWSDVELDNGRLHLRRSYGRYGFGEPKSRAGRRAVALTPSLVKELRRHKLAAPPNEHGLVFASQVGTPIDPDNVWRAWTRALRKAKLRHMPMHALRHTAVSMMIEAGANPKQLQAMIGHSSIQLTFDTYGHLMPDSLEGLARALDAIDLEPLPRSETANG